MDLTLDPSNPLHANIRAALSVAFQGLLRSQEYALKPGKVWTNQRHVSRKDIKELSVDVLLLMRDLRLQLCAVLRLRPVWVLVFLTVWVVPAVAATAPP